MVLLKCHVEDNWHLILFCLIILLSVLASLHKVWLSFPHFADILFTFCFFANMYSNFDGCLLTHMQTLIFAYILSYSSFFACIYARFSDCFSTLLTI